MTNIPPPPPDASLRLNDDVGKIREIGKGPEKGLLLGAKEVKDQAPPSALGVSDTYGAGGKEGSAVKEYQGLVADGVSPDEVAHVHTSAARTLRALGIDPPPQLADAVKLYRSALGLEPSGQLDMSLVARSQEVESVGGKGNGGRSVVYIRRWAAREGIEPPTDLGTVEGRRRHRGMIARFQKANGLEPTGILDGKTAETALALGMNWIREGRRELRALRAERSQLLEQRAQTKDPAKLHEIDKKIAKLDKRIAAREKEVNELLGELKDILSDSEFAAFQDELQQIDKGNDGTPKDTVELSDGANPTQPGGKPESPPPPAPVKENPKAEAVPDKGKTDGKTLDDALILKWLSQMRESDRKALRDLLDAGGPSAFDQFGRYGQGQLAELLKNPAAMAAEINKMGIASVSADGTITLRSGITVKGHLKPTG